VNPKVACMNMLSIPCGTLLCALCRPRQCTGVWAGRETFSQLIGFNFDTHSFTVEDAPWVISDQPRYASALRIIPFDFPLPLFFFGHLPCPASFPPAELVAWDAVVLGLIWCLGCFTFMCSGCLGCCGTVQVA